MDNLRNSFQTKNYFPCNVSRLYLLRLYSSETGEVDLLLKNIWFRLKKNKKNTLNLLRLISFNIHEFKFTT